MMHVVMISPGTLEGFSTSLRALYLAKEVFKRGDTQVDLLVRGNESDQALFSGEYHGVRIHYLPTRSEHCYRRFSPLALWEMLVNTWIAARRIRSLKPDLVHVFKPAPASLLPALFGGAPIVQDVDDADHDMLTANSPHANLLFRAAVGLLEKHCRRFAAHLTVASHALFRAGPNGQTPIAYIPNGAEPVREAVHDGKREAYCPKENILVVYVGALEKSFDTDQVLDSFRLVQAERPQTRLMIVGGGVQAQALAQQAAALDIAHVTTLCGHVSPLAVRKILAAADICVLPMRDTRINRLRCPLKLREYLAAGKPVVASDVGEAGHVLKGSPFLVPAGDLKAFAGRVVELVDSRDLRRREAKESARRAAGASWAESAERLCDVYRSALKRRPSQEQVEERSHAEKTRIG